MSRQLISRSPDLKRLQDEGFEIEILSGHLLVHAVPYVNSCRVVARGTLVTDLTLAGDITTRPGSHIAFFIGEHPCRTDGVEIPQIKLANGVPPPVAHGILAQHSFSNKPATGYADYYEMMTRYIEIISAPATALEPGADARTFKVIESSENDCVFHYVDTASSRSGIGALQQKLAVGRVAIIGLGGTGSYVLDLVAKTPVKQIHLFDGDQFLQHNAFRSPGAASLDALLRCQSKVAYLKQIYASMHRGIVAHERYATAADVLELQGFDFVFICVDKGSARRLIIEALQAANTPFIDVGMGIELIEETGELLGICRVTSSTATAKDHVARRVSLSGVEADDAYARNIQIADLNALNAALAVIKWKKLCGFYQDLEREHHSTYSVNVNQLTSDELA
jgi:ThiF family